MQTLPTYVSHSCCNSKVLGFCAFKLTVIAIYQSLFLHWNSILGNCFTVYHQNTHIDLLLKQLSFSEHSEITVAGHLLLLLHSISSSYLTFAQNHGVFFNVMDTCPCERSIHSTYEVFKLSLVEITHSQRKKNPNKTDNILFYSLSFVNLYRI